MLQFRTVLLWLAFILLLLQYLVDIRVNITLGIIFRLMPSAVLLLWFVLSVFFKEKVKLDSETTPKFILRFLRVVRPLASISIVIGALFKIMHWPGGNLLLTTGIGFMAVYSGILSRYAQTKSEENPDILDDNLD